MIGADAQVNRVAGHAGRDVEPLGYVAVLGVASGVSVRVRGGGGQRYALANLDECRSAFAGLHLLHAAFTAGGTVLDHSRAAAAARRAVAGVDADQQAFRRGIELRDQGAKFFDLAGLCVHDQLIAIGTDGAFVAQKGFGDRQQIGTGAVVERDDFSRRKDVSAEGDQHRGERCIEQVAY